MISGSTYQNTNVNVSDEDFMYVYNKDITAIKKCIETINKYPTLLNEQYFFNNYGLHSSK
jgi:hypothetical protein